jgi:putative NIF3 family GTP cyclohydrolase 1 type 2
MLNTCCKCASDARVCCAQESHPYEEPAFDVYERLATPLASGTGMGRVGALPAPMTRQQLAEHVKRALGLPQVLVVAPNQLGGAAGTSAHARCIQVQRAMTTSWLTSRWVWARAKADGSA